MILFLLFLVLLVLGIVYFIKSKKSNEPNDKAKKTLLASLVFFVLFVIRCVSVDAFMMLGFIAFVLGIGYFVYCLFKKQPKKKALCMILAGFLVFAYASSISNPEPIDSSPEVSTTKKVKKKEVEKVEVADLSQTDAQAWCDQNGFQLSKEEDFSDSIAQGGFISQSPQAGTKLEKGSTVTVHYSKGKEPTMEDKNALAKAEVYSSTMHMSKSRIYRQLTSSYGEGFPPEAAQYAVDHLVADYKANALEKAKDYQTTMNMSKSRIYNQLTSNYGEGFTAEEAQYAVDHLPQ
ncbi:Ltp family lipoprotein [Catenibacterium sp.]|uniref:Ltp family lipoprotein n=1 Tax=Catenibacterium sp. TaxID=2049022 RepID=UPI002E787BDC|nr:Ltp family lipoprotein [Catenibacterium sp.]MEE0041935.1 Ltp family lipoprotein [Catenibacterium sp.]